MIPEFVPISYIKGLNSSTSTKTAPVLIWIEGKGWIEK
jgi:hypothetical protein